MGNRKWLSGGAIAVAIVAIGKETLIWLWGKMLDIFSTSATSYDWSSFPWWNTAALILGISGLFGLFWPEQKKRPAHPSSDQLLAQRCYRAIRALQSAKNANWIKRDPSKYHVAIGNAASALVMLEKRGLVVPEFDDDNEQATNQMIAYLSGVAPMLADGNGDVACEITRRVNA